MDVDEISGSQALFDAGGSTWCGSGCGTCYKVIIPSPLFFFFPDFRILRTIDPLCHLKLTSTGKAPCQMCGYGGGAGQSIIVMVTNLCPYNPNSDWCPEAHAANQYGYDAHFDIMVKDYFGWSKSF